MADTVKKVETPNLLQERFDALGIAAETFSHPPVFRVGEDAAFAHLLPGGHTKNLFLKDKKGVLWLVTALQDTVIDLKWLPQRLNAARFSFGSAELLQEVLGVTPGSVTPLALINDSGRRVNFVLDAALLAQDLLNCHPLRNDMTTALRPRDLLRFAESLGYAPAIIDFSGK